MGHGRLSYALGVEQDDNKQKSRTWTKNRTLCLVEWDKHAGLGGLWRTHG